MNDFSIAYLVVGERQRREVLSALPDAPVVPYVARRPRRTHATLTARLHGLAPAGRRRTVRVAGPTPCTDC